MLNFQRSYFHNCIRMIIKLKSGCIKEKNLWNFKLLPNKINVWWLVNWPYAIVTMADAQTHQMVQLIAVSISRTTTIHESFCLRIALIHQTGILSKYEAQISTNAEKCSWNQMTQGSRKNLIHRLKDGTNIYSALFMDTLFSLTGCTAW